MHAMQYELTLPADNDMGAIRARVTRVGSEVMADAVGEVGRLSGQDGAVLAAVVVDTRNWELVHFSLWEHDAPKAEGEVCQVLHLSSPGRDRLPRGRQW